MIYTTLNRIRAHSPSADAWRKLLTHLGKAAADDEPLAYSAILDAVGLDGALWCLRAEPQHSNIWRMYAVRAARSVQHLMGDERSIHALDVAERHARGAATSSELAAAHAAARAVAQSETKATAEYAAWAAAWGAFRYAAFGAWLAANDAARAYAWAYARTTAEYAASGAWGAAWAAAWDDAYERMTANFRALLASHEALPGETCALNEWGLTEFKKLEQA